FGRLARRDTSRTKTRPGGCAKRSTRSFKRRDARWDSFTGAPRYQRDARKSACKPRLGLAPRLRRRAARDGPRERARGARLVRDDGPELVAPGLHPLHVDAEHETRLAGRLDALAVERDAHALDLTRRAHADAHVDLRGGRARDPHTGHAH